MDKKELKFYETPTCEVVELNGMSSLLAGSSTAGDPIDPSEDEQL